MDRLHVHIIWYENVMSLLSTIEHEVLLKVLKKNVKFPVSEILELKIHMQNFLNT